MTERVMPCGSGYQVMLPNGNIVKSENKKALDDLLANTQRALGRESRIAEAWNNAVRIVGTRYREHGSGRETAKDPSRRVRLNWRQVEYAVGRVDRSEGAFLAALAAFEEPAHGALLLKRLACTDIRSLAESLSVEQARAVATLLVAHHDG